MTCICIGPVCIPIYSIVPFLLYFCKVGWDWIKSKVLGQQPQAKEKTEKKDDKKEEAECESKCCSSTTTVRRRSKYNKALGTAKVVEITSVEHWEDLMEHESRTVVAKFTASWCRPCQVISPVYHELCSEYGTDQVKNPITFSEIDVDDLDEIAGEHSIAAMPFFVVFRQGKELERVMGADESKLRNLVHAHCQ